MDGIHDMGGMHGFGRVAVEPAEPVFHAPWQRRVLGMAYQLVGFGWLTVDAFRHGIERIPPVTMPVPPGTTTEPPGEPRARQRSVMPWRSCSSPSSKSGAASQRRSRCRLRAGSSQSSYAVRLCRMTEFFSSWMSPGRNSMSR